MTEQELAELDLAVAKAEGIAAAIMENEALPLACYADGRSLYEPYRPTRDRDLAMRLLEKYDLSLSRRRRGGASPSLKWHAWIKNKVHKAEGETPCIAICRVVVALKGVPA